MIVAQAFARSPEKGAETLVWLAASPEAANVTGGYFVDRRLLAPSDAARIVEAARQLWDVSERQIGGSHPPVSL